MKTSSWTWRNLPEHEEIFLNMKTSSRSPHLDHRACCRLTPSCSWRWSRDWMRHFSRFHTQLQPPNLSRLRRRWWAIRWIGQMQIFGNEGYIFQRQMSVRRKFLPRWFESLKLYSGKHTSESDLEQWSKDYLLSPSISLEHQDSLLKYNLPGNPYFKLVSE